MHRTIIALSLMLGVASLGGSQDLSVSPEARGVLRLRVRVKTETGTSGVSRKRFFLIKGSLQQNKAVVDSFEQRPVVSRDCYYKNSGASLALINWLRENDCETVYCREIAADDVEGAKAIPEFVAALAAGEKEFGNRQLARKWLTVNLPDKLRHGFYIAQQSQLQAAIKQAETLSHSPVHSVMTDRNGTAYFTELEPGTYTLSNFVPFELGPSSVSWNCEVQVKPGDLATEKPFLLSNRKDKNVKCVAVEKPLPQCN